VLLSATETRRLLLENKVSARFRSCKVNPEIEILNFASSNQAIGHQGLQVRKRGARAGARVPLCRPQEGRHDENQRVAAVPRAIVVCRSTRGGRRWATDDRTLSGERVVWRFPRRETPVPAWAGVIAPELHGSHESSGLGPEDPSPLG